MIIHKDCAVFLINYIHSKKHHMRLWRKIISASNHRQLHITINFTSLSASHHCIWYTFQLAAMKLLRSVGTCDHECNVLPLYRQLFLIGSSLLYCADIFTDIYVSVDTLLRSRDVVIGCLMLFFVILPLIYSNFITQRNRYSFAKLFQDTQVFWFENLEI